MISAETSPLIIQIRKHKLHMNWKNLPSLNALRSFLAFHQAGSMATAGALLNVSHAAISQQIKALEAHMSVGLLDRRARRTVLTPEGLQLAQAIEAGFGEISRIVELLTEVEENRPLQISVTPSFASGWLMPRLADFRQRFPEIDLMIDPSAEVKTLEPGGIDIALRYGDGNWPGHKVQLLVSSPIVVIAAPSLMPGEQDIHPRDLLNLPWLQELGTHESSQWLTQMGVVGKRTAGVTSLPGNLLIEAARMGQGIAVAARTLVAADIAAGRLRVLFQDSARSGYYVVTREGVQRTALRALTRWLRRQADQPDVVIAQE